jgi:hypothetical protein
MLAAGKHQGQAVVGGQGALSESFGQPRDLGERRIWDGRAGVPRIGLESQIALISSGTT